MNDMKQPETILYNDDCYNALKKLPDNSIDTCITDPPYGLSKQPDMVDVLSHWLNEKIYNPPSKGFMGKSWDSFVPSPLIWKEVYRVLKSGAICMVFGGTRTYDLTTIALRLAGFEIRDTIMWVYGTGFPKSLNISKAIDKKLGADRKVIGKQKITGNLGDRETFGANDRTGGKGMGFRPGEISITEPATDQAKLWDGYGTQLKPAWEPIIIAMKPVEKTFVDNALNWGVGGYNIDECRVGKREKEQFTSSKRVSGFGGDAQDYKNQNFYEKSATPLPEGRFPANLIHDGSDEVLELFPQSNNSDSAARFFYSAKVSKSERNIAGENKHPTLKPLALMEYLVKLTKTPTGGIVLDPFAGSGTTGCACVNVGRDFIGIELEKEYFEVAQKRIDYYLRERMDASNNS